METGAGALDYLFRRGKYSGRALPDLCIRTTSLVVVPRATGDPRIRPLCKTGEKQEPIRRES